jgi:hypothetical protein
MRRLTTLLAILLVLAPTTAAGALTPGRTISNSSSVTALSVTRNSVVWAVGRSTRDCGHVRLWDTATKGLWTFGHGTLRGCEEGPSGGAGFSDVATSGRRVFWITYIGGNITDYRLWTATHTRRSPRLVASVEAASDDPSPFVLGVGTPDGVPYALENTVTYVSDTGARLFRVTLEAPVRLLAAGPNHGPARVVAALANGKVVVLSRTGVVLDTHAYDAGAVRAVALAFGGPVVQVGSTINVGWSGTGGQIVLPAGALMLDYRERTVFYRLGAELRSRGVGTNLDRSLQRFPIRSWQPMLFSIDLGLGWAVGATLNWRT